MSFNLFKKNNATDEKTHKGYISINESMYNAPFEDIIACMDPKYLEDAVIYYFDEILPYRKASEYKYFRMFSSWEKLVGDKLDDILNSFKHIEDFKTLINIFPEYAAEIYIYLLEAYIFEITGSITTNYDEIDIINDVLIPMADLERYEYYITGAQSNKFSIVRDKAYEILDNTSSYTELWDVIQVFEQYFDYPNDEFWKLYSDYSDNNIEKCFFDEFVLAMDYSEEHEKGNNHLFKYDSVDYNDLVEFFKDREAYEYFMDHLPELLKHSGLDLYALMIKVLGPIKEVTNLYGCCAEFLSDE